ncbi:MAG: tetratricopeptide repeat protein [Acidobacteriota bacterium]
MSVIIWGHRGKTVELGPAGSFPCPNCGQTRAFKNVLEYQSNHVYYILGFVSKKRYLRRCEVCGRGERLEATAVESLGRVPIPWLDRFGCLAALGAIAGLILLAVVFAQLQPPPRNVPDLIERVHHGDAAALARLRSEAAADDVPSQEALMDLLMSGAGVPQDWSESFRWAKRAAEHGLPRAEHALGAMYELGHGTEVDYAQALHWYQAADAQGIAASANSIGALYLQGHGITEDAKAAVTWFRKAAEAGDGPGAFNLAMRYLVGDGVAADAAEARRWLERSAATPGADATTRTVVAAAELQLGLLYESGTGVEKDAVKALHYFESAAPLNDEAKQNFERLKARLAGS